MESEKSLIGSLLYDHKCLDIVRQYVKGPEYFKNELCGKVYEVILQMSNEDKAIDIVTVSDNIPSKSAAVFLAEAMSTTPTSAHVEEYAINVRDSYARRRIKNVLLSFNPLDQEKYKTTMDVVTYLEKGVSDAHAIIQQKSEVTLEELVHARLGEYERGDSAKRVISTGYYDLDDIVIGLEESENIIIAGRPSMGKTSISLNIALNVARKKKKVMFFSLEMSKERLVDRLLVVESGVEAVKLKTGKFSDEEYLSVLEAAQRVIQMPIIIIDDIYSTIEMRSRIAKESLKSPVSLAVVDYLQLISDKRGFESRNTEVGYYTRQMAQIAKKFNTTVIALSQLSRNVENRANKRPILSDLYESGGVEANADKVIFVYRDEYYHPDTEDRGICEIGVAKNRDGKVGKCKLLFVPQTLSFKNLARSDIS